MDTAISVMLRPLVFLVFVLIAAGIAKVLDLVIPEGRVKRFLYKERLTAADRRRGAKQVLQRAQQLAVYKGSRPR